ncbi:hypothetical protein [Sphingomonas sp.]|uniref:hypothetical protein n=1 Tax=Sphingomonas sp. TaxID=28214 RepID=UPI0028A956FA|nr:hypothetical protein [Sphingomonas sp.]
MGHWESKAIAAFNDELLNSAGCSWDDWQAFNTDWYRSPLVAQFARRARKLLRQEFGDEALFVLKDPRLCLVAPFWLRVLEEAGVKTCIVMPLRAPAEVAGSLHRRDATNIWTGKLLWLRYVLEAEVATRGHDRLVTTYAQLLGEWRTLVSRTSEHFDLVFPRQTPSTGREVDDFLVPKSENAPPAPPRRRLPNDGGFDLTGWIDDVYEIFHRWAQTEEDPKDHPRLDEIRERFDQVSHALGPIFSTAENRGNPGEGELMRRELGDLRARLQEAESGRQELERQVQELAAEKAELIARHADAAAHIAQLDEDRTRLASDLEQAQRQTQALEAELEIARTRLSQFTAESEGHRDTIGRFEEHERTLSAELDAARARIDALTRDVEAEAGRFSDAHGRVQALEAELGINQAHAQNLGAELGASREHAQRIEAELEIATSRVRDLDGEKQALVGQCHHLQQDQQEKEAALAQAAQERASLLQDLEHALARANHLNGELETKIAAVKDATDDRDRLEQKIASQAAQTASFWKRLKWLAQGPREGG